jgi:feruloyl esterase
VVRVTIVAATVVRSVALTAAVVVFSVLVPATGAEGAVLPRLPVATGRSLVSCSELTAAFRFPNTMVLSATRVESGALTWAGRAIGAHCLVKGEMHRRTSPQDGKSYAVGFEMRLPNAWNGRFFYQANGGMDGRVATALGGGGPQQTTALGQGFAVISSDAGHADGDDPSFGIDYQARLDYGYEAVAKLTPMAKALIAAAYGKGPAAATRSSR